MADTDLPPVPYQTPPVGPNGMLTQPWATWFRQLFIRVGQNFAPSISSLFISPLTALGDLIYGGVAGAATRLGGNTSSTKKFLTQTGSGTASASPAWSAIAAADVPTLNQNTTGTAASITGNLTGDVTSVGMATTLGTVGIAKGGTGQTTAGAAFDALSPNTTKGDLTVRNSSTNVRLPIGSDGQVPVADSSQSTGLAWKTLQQGSKNYVTYNSFENNATTGWSLFNTTLTGVNPTGSITASASSVTTFAATATNPLAGSYSLQTASSAAWSAGQGFITDALAIDREDYKFGRVLTFSARYEIVSGQSNLNLSGGTSNTFAVYIYDVTNSAWIQPSGVYSFMGDGLLKGTFQLPTTCTSVRLAILAVNASGGAVTVNWDDFSLGPQTISYGAPVTDWEAYTPTLVGFGAATNINFSKRRVGDSQEVIGTLTAGTTSGTLTVSLPSGLTTDSSKVSTSVWELVGHGYDSVNVTAAMVMLAKGGNTTVSLGYAGSNGTVPYPSGGDNGANYVLWFRVPILGWSSSVQMSNSTDTRVCRARATLSTDPAVSANAVIPYDAVTYDTHGAITLGASFKFTAPSPGFYDVSVNGGGGVSFQWLLYKNGVNQFHFGINASSTSRGSGVASIQLNAGDYIDIRPDSSVTMSGAAVTNYVQISKASGPSSIAASEVVSLRVPKTSGTASVSAAWTDVTSWDAATFNSHGSACWDGTTFTAPDPGRYLVAGGISFLSNSTGVRASRIVKNGSTVCQEGVYSNQAGFQARAPFVDEVQLLAGETIKIQYYQDSGGALGFSTAPGYANLTITRVANY